MNVTWLCTVCFEKTSMLLMFTPLTPVSLFNKQKTRCGVHLCSHLFLLLSSVSSRDQPGGERSRDQRCEYWDGDVLTGSRWSKIKQNVGFNSYFLLLLHSGCFSFWRCKDAANETRRVAVSNNLRFVIFYYIILPFLLCHCFIILGYLM